MKFLLEIEPENVFERPNLKKVLKDYITVAIPSKFKLKKISFEKIE